MENIERLSGKLEELNNLAEYISTHEVDKHAMLMYLSLRSISITLDMDKILDEMAGDNHE